MKGTAPMTGADRAKRYRTARKAEGWRAVTVHLDPQAAANLERIQGMIEGSQGQVIALALENLLQTHAELPAP